MKQLVNITATAIGTVLILSCGTGKKLAAALQENTKLNSVVTDQAAKLAVNDKEIGDLKTENIAYGKEAQDCREVKEALIRKKENLDKALAEKGTSLEEIASKAQAAVKKFEDAGCEVDYKNGRFHITVPDEFSFKSGSSTVGPKGRAALNVVAQVMYDNPGVYTTIVGNTDTVSIKGVADNWSLSTERASAVVRVLADVYNINPKRLTAAGRSKFNPVASNDTEEGRAKNRRIEIIINPDLDRLWEMTSESE